MMKNKLKIFALLAVFFFVFYSCDKTFRQTKEPDNIDCKSDSLGEYGNCISFGGSRLTNGIWVVKEEQGKILYQEIVFYPFGEAYVCKKGDCLHDDTYKHIYSYRVKNNTLTIYDVQKPQDSLYSAKFQKTQKSELVFSTTAGNNYFKNIK